MELAKFIVSDAMAAWKLKVLSVVTKQARINNRKAMPRSFQKNEAATVNMCRMMHCS
ncbi:MAG: hypothetical protein WD534_11065 [Phycisphaeraceae bacterium]